jgi:hypothetical protein
MYWFVATWLPRDNLKTSWLIAGIPVSGILDDMPD